MPHIDYPDLFDRRIGFGFFSNDRHRILMRTLEMIEQSPICEPELKTKIVSIKEAPWPKMRGFLLAEFFSALPAATMHWALYRALLDAEHQFCESTLPTWEHEDKLTGDLVGKMIEYVRDWGLEVKRINPSLTPIRFCRTNTVFNRGEAVSGADFGLIIQRSDRDFSSIVIQAKRISGDGADVSQAVQSTGELQRNTLNKTPHLGHYLFFVKPDGDRAVPPPLMVSAHEVVSSVANRGTNTFRALSHGIDLATYLAYGSRYRREPVGVKTTSPNDAAKVMFNGYPSLKTALEKIVVVSMGEGRTFDWDKVLSSAATVKRGPPPIALSM